MVSQRQRTKLLPCTCGASLATGRSNGWLPWSVRVASLGGILLQFVLSAGHQDAPPFELVYGRPPPSIRMYAPGDARLPAVERAMKDRDEFLAEVRDRLEQSQQHYNTVYDRCHRPVEFVPGQWVWLRVLHRLVASLQVQGWGKLGPKFLGPIKCWDALVMWPTSWRCRWA